MLIHKNNTYVKNEILSRGHDSHLCHMPTANSITIIASSQLNNIDPCLASSKTLTSN